MIGRGGSCMVSNLPGVIKMLKTPVKIGSDAGSIPAASIKNPHKTQIVNSGTPPKMGWFLRGSSYQRSN